MESIEVISMCFTDMVSQQNKHLAFREETLGVSLYVSGKD